MYNHQAAGKVSPLPMWSCGGIGNSPRHVCSDSSLMFLACDYIFYYTRLDGWSRRQSMVDRRVRTSLRRALRPCGDLPQDHQDIIKMSSRCHQDMSRSQSQGFGEGWPGQQEKHKIQEHKCHSIGADHP